MVWSTCYLSQEYFGGISHRLPFIAIFPLSHIQSRHALQRCLHFVTPIYPTLPHSPSKAFLVTILTNHSSLPSSVYTPGRVDALQDTLADDVPDLEVPLVHAESVEGRRLLQLVYHLADEARVLRGVADEGVIQKALVVLPQALQPPLGCQLPRE